MRGGCERTTGQVVQVGASGTLSCEWETNGVAFWMQRPTIHCQNGLGIGRNDATCTDQTNVRSNKDTVRGGQKPEFGPFSCPSFEFDLAPFVLLESPGTLRRFLLTVIPKYDTVFHDRNRWRKFNQPWTDVEVPSHF